MQYINYVIIIIIYTYSCLKRYTEKTTNLLSSSPEATLTATKHTHKTSIRTRPFILAKKYNIKKPNGPTSLYTATDLRIYKSKLAFKHVSYLNASINDFIMMS